jgi:hypothetical protein
VGDWTIKDVCLQSSVNGLGSSCPDASWTVTPLNVAGTVSVKADNTETSDFSLDLSESLHIPASCYTEANCQDYGKALSAATSVTSSSCSYDAATGCSCTMNVSQAAMGSGTYQVDGTNVTFTDSKTGKPSVSSFCVSGNTWSLSEVNNSGFVTSMTLTR